MTVATAVWAAYPADGGWSLAIIHAPSCPFTPGFLTIVSLTRQPLERTISTNNKGR